MTTKKDAEKNAEDAIGAAVGEPVVAIPNRFKLQAATLVELNALVARFKGTKPFTGKNDAIDFLEKKAAGK